MDENDPLSPGGLAQGVGGALTAKLASMLGGPLGMALGIGGPMLLSAIFGSRGEDAMTMRKRAQEFLDPYAIQKEQDNQYAMLLNSPALAAARAQAIQSGQAGAQAINARLGQTGLGRSGVGMALEGAVRAAPDIQIMQMLGGLHDTAGQRALDIQKLRAQMRMSGQPQNSMVREMGGAMMASILPAILNYKGSTKAVKPQTATNSTPTYGNTNVPINGMRAPAGGYGTGQFMNQPYQSPYYNKSWDSPFKFRKFGFGGNYNMSNAFARSAPFGQYDPHYMDWYNAPTRP